MKVQKTVCRKGATLAHGLFQMHQTVHVCDAGCAQQGSRVTARATALSLILPPKCVAGYDVIVYVGIERFLHHLQREEIRTALENGYGVSLSTGEISVLAHRFLVYLERLHQASAPALRAALAADGGWPLHTDATGEDGRGTLLVAFAGWRRWVLGAWKIPTERAEAILPKLQDVVVRFGPPCSIMRDLGRAMTEAVQALIEKSRPAIPVLACHLHFLRDIGKDLLEESHDQLRALFRQVQLRSKLRVLARDLGRGLGSAIQQARQDLQLWQTEKDQGHRLPEGAAGLATVRALAQWILDYPADGADQGFPFDLPWLALYDRCLQVCYALQTYLENPPDDPQVKRALLRMQRILHPVECNKPAFGPVAETLTVRSKLFSQLRQALRLLQEPSGGNPESTEGRPTGAELADIRAAVDKLSLSLRIRRGQRICSKDKGQAIEVILAHLDAHGDYLWGHAIPIPEAYGGGVRLVDRTNNVLESFFHTLKHGERRRSGRKILTQDFEQLPPAAALAANLTHADYVSIVCGTLRQLPEAFAKLDHQQAQPPAGSKVAEVVDLESASLSKIDRRQVRNEGMSERIMSAAQRCMRKRKAA